MSSPAEQGAPARASFLGKDCIIAFLFAAGFVLLNLPGLSRSPLVWIDEVVSNEPALRLAQEGRLVSELLSERWGTDKGFFLHPPGHAFVVSIFYRLFGFGIVQTRLSGLFFGGLVLASLYFGGRTLFGTRLAGALPALIFGLDPKVIQIARSGRMDMEAIFFALSGFLAFLAATSAESPKRFLKLLLGSGLLFGLGGLFHPVCGFWVPGLVLLILSERNRPRLPGAALFCLAAALPVSAWGGWAFSQGAGLAEQFGEHVRLHLASGGIIARLGGELSRYITSYLRAPLLLFAYLAGLGWFILGRREQRVPGKILLAPLFAVFFLNALLLIKTGSASYFLHTVVLLALMSGGMMEHALSSLERNPGPAGKSAVFMLVLVFLNCLAGGYLGRWFALFRQWEARDYRQVEEAIREAVPPGSVVTGACQVWYAVEKTGARLHLVKQADPSRHDFLVVKAGRLSRYPGFVKVKEFGRPLPPLLPGLAPPDYDYHLEIWRAKR